MAADPSRRLAANSPNGSHVHELVELGDSYLPSTIKMDDLVNNDADKYLRSYSAAEREFVNNLVANGGRYPIYLSSSWPPSPLEGLEDLTCLTPLINNTITRHKKLYRQFMGQRGVDWGDPFPFGPAGEGKVAANAAQARDTSLYKDQDRDNALLYILEEVVIPIEESEIGGLGFADVCTACLSGPLAIKLLADISGSPSLVKIILNREPRRPKGATDPTACWKIDKPNCIYDDSITALTLSHGDDVPRKIIVNTAPCWPFDSRPGISNDAKTLKSKRESAKMLQFMNLVTQFFRGLDPLTEWKVERSMERTLHNNFLSLSNFWEFLVVVCHIPPTSATLHIKNLLDFDNKNLNDEGSISKIVDGRSMPTMMRAARDEETLRLDGNAYCAARKDEEESEMKPSADGDGKKKKRTNDSTIINRMVNTLSSSTDTVDVVDLAGRGVESSTKSERLKTLTNTDEHIIQPLRGQLKKVHKQLRHNGGNETESHRTCSKAEVQSHDEMLQIYSSKSAIQANTKFTCALGGLGNELSLPMDGTLVGGQYPFDSSQNVPLAYESIRQRCGQRKPLQNNTQHTKSLKFPHLALKKVRVDPKLKLAVVQFVEIANMDSITPEQHVEFVRGVQAATKANMDLSKITELCEFISSNYMTERSPEEVEFHLRFANNWNPKELQVVPEKGIQSDFTAAEDSAFLHGVTAYGMPWCKGKPKKIYEQFFLKSSDRKVDSMKEKVRSPAQRSCYEPIIALWKNATVFQEFKVKADSLKYP